MFVWWYPSVIAGPTWWEEEGIREAVTHQQSLFSPCVSGILSVMFMQLLPSKKKWISFLLYEFMQNLWHSWRISWEKFLSCSSTSHYALVYSEGVRMHFLKQLKTQFYILNILRLYFFLSLHKRQWLLLKHTPQQTPNCTRNCKSSPNELLFSVGSAVK